MPISLRALARVPSVSKAEPASTSVETRPGTILRISQPKVTKSLSMNATGASGWSPGECEGEVERLVYQVLVVRLLGRLEEQGRVGGRVLRLVLGDGFEVARVGHDRRIAFQRFEKIQWLPLGSLVIGHLVGIPGECG